MILKSQLRSPIYQAVYTALNSVSGVGAPSFYLNLSNATNATIADSQGRGTIYSVRDAVISSSISVSRTSGVAPLYVNFDYSATTSSASTNAPHECFFATDFGDPSSGAWANGVQSSGLTSKNAGYGPVTGHVYETPGTYHPQVTVIDGDGNLSSRTATITVQDPDDVYAGTNTICLSHSGNFTGAPSGSSQPVITGNTDMYSLLNTYKASNKRILFCKADNWTVSASMQMTSITGMTVGGYGTGVARAFGSGTLVNVDASAATAGSVFLTTTGCSDIRICDLKVLGGFQSNSGVTLSNSISQFTAYRLEFLGTSSGFTAYPGGGGSSSTFDQHCIYECVVDDLYGYAGVDLYAASASGAIGTPGVFTATDHIFKLGNPVRLTGTPPSPLAIDTTYYISSASLSANTFTLSSSAANAISGTALALSGAGTCNVETQGSGGGVGAFIGLTRGGLMGCYFDNCNHGEQTVRIPFLDRAHISNNTIKRPNQGKNVVKIHGFMYKDFPLYTEKFVFSANVMDLRGGYSYGTALGYTSVGGSTTVTQVGDSTIITGNGGNPGDERVRDSIYEHNFTYGCLGNPKSSQSFIGIGGPNMTARNNIADFSLDDRTSAYTSNYSNTAMKFASVSTTTHDQTKNVRIYNNTLYSNMVNAELASFVGFGSLPNATAPSASGAIGTPGVFTATAHKLLVNDRVHLVGTPPAPLAINTDYWISATSFTANQFVLKSGLAGADLALSGTGTCEVSPYYQPDDIKIQNNVWYYPHHNPANNYTNATYNQAGAAPTNVVANNNTDNNGGLRTSPGFVNTPPRDGYLTDWKPSGYPVKTTGTPVLLRDFNNASRVGGFDHLGAVLP